MTDSDLRPHFANQLLHSEDLTELARAGQLVPAIVPQNSRRDSGNDCLPELIDRMARGLYRRRARHILLTGKRGVGKTTWAWELARCSQAGLLPFLAETQIVWIDCQYVAPDESRRVLASIIDWATPHVNLVVCLDGLGPLLRSVNGADNKALFRKSLHIPAIRFVGILSQWDFDDLLAGEAEVLELCTRISVDEPDEATALEIAARAAERLGAEYRLVIDSQTVNRAVLLSSRYVWNDCLPAKSIKVLQRICEDADYERTQLRDHSSMVTPARVIRVISELTHVPEVTLAGDSPDVDFENVLASAVVGQDQAVRDVATELRLVRAGLSDPGKPASVMLFCGQNGVGKTELAKRLAEVYSASKQLQIFTMGNFVESHSVSGLIGVPAGYVGHDQGGPLINGLLADPYAIVLIDEIEKAHPDVMKPLLNLFDEGWIVDQRGVKAYGDRAIFVLTSNAGSDAITQMSADLRPMDEIAEYVKSTLATIRNERSGQPVLSQAFLARLKRIIIFHPLDRSAMLAIARMQIEKMIDRWRIHRQRRLLVADPVAVWIAEQGMNLNEKSAGREGGRSIRRLLGDGVESVILREIVSRRADYSRSTSIAVSLNEADCVSPLEAGETAPRGSPQVKVDFLYDA